MNSPEISVVMSVYNGAAHLGESVESILSQEDVDFEFVIVNDGSTDNSGNILEDYKVKDNRIKVVHQENQGLTRALIRGCSEAQGEYIARQDVGDTALPGKLKKLLAMFNRNRNAALVSCGTRFVAPHGEYLYDANIDPEKAQSCLLTLDIRKIRGVSSHGSVLFRKSLYDEVGGYRADFYFAQDLDLWIRLAERGSHVVIPEVLQLTQFAPNSVSGYHRGGQVKLAKIILECACLRREGRSERLALEKAREIKPGVHRIMVHMDHAKALYFIGSCLRGQGNPAARTYFKEAFRASPFYFRSALRLLFG